MPITHSQVAKNSALLSTLHPDIKPIAQRILLKCGEQGIELLIVQAKRTVAEQDALYAIGRTRPGKAVTNARGGYSWHNFGRAFDVAIVKDGKPDWSDTASYNKVGALGQSLGLVWGGSFGDSGHFEYHPGLTLKQAREQAGIV